MESLSWTLILLIKEEAGGMLGDGGEEVGRVVVSISVLCERSDVVVLGACRGRERVSSVGLKVGAYRDQVYRYMRYEARIA